VSVEDILAQPHQIGDALWRIDAAGISRRSLSGGVLVGGEESIGGALAAAALGDRATGYVRAGALEPWAREDTLVLCASYTGDGEDALECFSEAGARGCPRVVVCTAGRLAARAREEDVPVIGVPSGMQPSASVIYVTLAALECAALVGAGPSLRAEAEAAGAALADTAPWEARAREIASSLAGRVPVIYDASGVGQRWAAQIEEATGYAAFWQDRPSRGRLRTDGLTAVPLDGLAGDATGLERVLSLVLLGDLVAIHMAN
jgi:hypothetical protein